MILIATFRLLEAPPETSGGRRHDLVAMRRFHELVEQHFADHWTLPRYAGELHMTEARLTDLCNRLMGRSPKRVVLERTALEARRFLAFSRLSVNEIATAMGFEEHRVFLPVLQAKPGRHTVGLSRQPARIILEKCNRVSGKVHFVAPASRAYCRRAIEETSMPRCAGPVTRYPTGGG